MSSYKTNNNLAHTIQMGGSNEATIRTSLPSIALGALMALCTYILPTSTLHTLIIRTDYTVTSLDHGNNSSANAF